MRQQLATMFFLILMGLSMRSYGAESHLELDLECTIEANNEEMGYTQSFYNDIFIVELRGSKSVSKILWKRKHPGANEYTRPEAIRGCAFVNWKLKTSNGLKKIEVSCANSGEDGILLLDFDSLEGELAFYNPQIGYPERSSFAVECKTKSK